MKSANLYSLKNALWSFAASFVLWILIQTYVLWHMGIDFSLALLDSGISAFLLSLFGAVTIMVYKYYQPGKSNRLYRFVYAIGIALFFSTSVKWIMTLLKENDIEYLYFLERSMPIRCISALLIFSFITIVNWLWYMLQDQKAREARKNEAEQLVKEAELVRLRQQLQPHFLFNSLNSISALAGTKPQEARKMIQQLSDFLRGTMRKDEKQLVTLKEELQNLQLYLEIEKVRFGHRLQVNIDVQEDSLEKKLPPLLLQPIVENAIKFGLYGTIEAIVIELNVSVENQFLMIEVKNPFDPEIQSSSGGSGFGLTYIQRRLFLLYARNDLMKTEQQENIFIARLKIPQV